MKKTVTCLTLLCTFLLFGAEPTEADRALVIELLKINGTAQSLEATINATLKQMQGEPDDPTRPILEKFLRKCFSFETLKDDIARVYLENYTPAELRSLLDFYRTPLGRKKAEADAKIGAALSAITNREFQKNLPELQKELEKTVQQ